MKKPCIHTLCLDSHLHALCFTQYQTQWQRDLTECHFEVCAIAATLRAWYWFICHESCCYLTRTGTSKSTIFPIGACIQATFSSSLFTAVLWIALACKLLLKVRLMTYAAYCVVLCLNGNAQKHPGSVLTCGLIDLWALTSATWIRVGGLTSAGIASDSLPSSSAILRKNNLLITPLGLYSRICKVECQLLLWEAWNKARAGSTGKLLLAALTMSTKKTCFEFAMQI